MSNYTNKKANKTIDDAIFDFIYIAAMRDATMRLAYRGEKEWLWNPKKATTEERKAVNEVKELLKTHILKIIGGYYSNLNKADEEKYEEYSKDLLELSSGICSIISSFRFGNAQKLINMTVKYFYITTFGQPEKRECFKYCHCPVDGKMLKRVWTDKIKQTEKWKSDDFQAAWSNEDFERYAAFQNAVRALVGKNGIPLEYDYMNWN